MLQQPGHVPLHARLTRVHALGLVHEGAQVDADVRRAIGADQRDHPALLRRVDGKVDRLRRARLHLEVDAHRPVYRRAGRLAAYRLDGRIGAAVVGHALHGGDQVDVLEVERLHAEPPAGKLEPVVDVIDRDDASGAHRPERPHGEQADGATAEHQHRLAALDLGHLRGLVPGGGGIGQRQRVQICDPIRNLFGIDTDEGQALVGNPFALLPDV